MVVAFYTLINIFTIVHIKTEMFQTFLYMSWMHKYNFLFLACFLILLGTEKD